YDEKMLIEDEVELVVQVNGKVRAKLTVALNEDDDKVKEMALTNENVIFHTKDKNIVKIIVVKNKIVNIVVK
ncbi:MAG: hypothetical protein PHS94_10005, partial [Erysipelotrichaceae bacterium]|nr:hypothetical protein [Erysipelotrichaceae bacterium]